MVGVLMPIMGAGSVGDLAPAFLRVNIRFCGHERISIYLSHPRNPDVG